MWQGPRIRLVAETGTQVFITAMSTIFYFVFLACFWSCFSPCSLVFLPRAVLAPVSSSSSCYLARAAVFLLAAFRIFLRHLYSVSFQDSFCFVFIVIFFVIIFWYGLFLLCSRTRYVGISLALRTYLDSFAIDFWGFSLYQSVTTEFVSL